MVSKKSDIQSLSEFKKGIDGTDYQPKEKTKEKVNLTKGINPFESGNGALVSDSTRKEVLGFAHPVDATVIKTLDNPAINTLFNKVVQTSIDATWGIALATGIHVDPNTYPELYDIIEECAKKLEMPIPYVIISDQVKGINACTAGTNQFAFIAVSPLLSRMFNNDELKFVIGHECGHLALGHVVYHTAINMFGSVGGLLPVVGEAISKTIMFPLNAWSRRSEISADRAGLICSGSIEVAARALLKLEAGLMVGVDNVDIDKYVDESEKVLDSTLIGRFGEIFMSHPIIPKRIKALKLFSDSVVYDRAMGGKPGQKPHLLSAARLSEEVEKIIEVI